MGVWRECVHLLPSVFCFISVLFYQDGGEVYFSDVYADSVISEDARKSEVLWGMFH